MSRKNLIILALCMGCTTSSSTNSQAPNSESSDLGKIASSDSSRVDTGVINEGGAVEFVAEVWADNWFAMHVGEELVAEDSVPITTERSFNAETFSFKATYPLHLNVIARDFKQDDSGLEYIGQPNQQMGDGGLILQVRDESSGKLVAVTDATWKCLPIHRAPLNKECEKSSTPDTDCTSEIGEEPEGWKSVGFDTSAWPQAVVHSEQSVRPKDGYDEITWDPTASLIWGEDLEIDNTLLCTVTVPAP
jgi:hypothetical protein